MCAAKRGLQAAGVFVLCIVSYDAALTYIWLKKREAFIFLEQMFE